MNLPRALAPVAAVLALVASGCGDDGPAAGTLPPATGDGAAAGAATTPPTEPATPPSTEPPPAPSTEPAASTAPADTATSATEPPADLAVELAGRTFLSEDVEGYDLVEGSRIELAFDESTVGAAAGCNRLSSGWSVDGDVLVVEEMAMTQMACEPPSLMDQDAWLAALLTSGPTAELDGDRLTLTADGARVVFVDREVADPDRPLEGTTWTVEGLVSADAVSSVPAGGRPPTLLLEGGAVTVDTGCNRGTGTYELDGEVVVFGPLATTRAACTDDALADAEQIVLATLAGEATATVEADVLTLTAGDVGLVLRASGDGAGGPAGLEGPTWTLDAVVDGPVTSAAPALDRPATLTFDAGELSVETGCNGGFGSYEVAGSTVTLGPITTTLIACEGAAGDVEQAVLAVLQGTVEVSVVDGVLTLTNGDRGLMYVAG